LVVGKESRAKNQRALNLFAVAAKPVIEEEEEGRERGR
jgi:hypothetical protein